MAIVHDRLFFLDFETRSRVNLPVAGAYRYAADPSTKVLQAGFAVGKESVERWRYDMPPSRWVRFVDDSRMFIVAHNAEFERLILRHKFNIDLPSSRFIDTAAMAARCGLPRSLGAVSRALKLHNLKDEKAGKRLINEFSKPHNPTRTRWSEFIEPEDKPGDFEDMADYNEADVEAMRELYSVLPKLSSEEQALWELTVRQNDRGLLVDIGSVRQAMRLADAEHEKLAERWFKLTGVPAGSPKSAAVLGLKSVDKVHVRHALRDNSLPIQVHEALAIRKRMAKTSVAKLTRLLQRVSNDGHYRGGLVYSGAERTQRWSAWGVQLHNLPRGLGEETNKAFQALNLGVLGIFYEDILWTLSDMLRGFFLGPLVVGDFSQIEARTEAWATGQSDLVSDFAAGKDIYSDMASSIYGTPITETDYDDELHIAKRQLGKIAVLGCGYGLGAAKLRRQMDEVFDVMMDHETAQNIVGIYRTKYPRIPFFWKKLQVLFETAIDRQSARLKWSDHDIAAGTVTFAGRPFAYLALPSGRNLYYYEPQMQDQTGSWPSGDPKTGREASYFGRGWVKLEEKRGWGWGRVSTYGGKLTENFTQALARDYLADAMLRMDKAGLPLVLSMHDEAVVEGGKEVQEEMAHIMSQGPYWAAGLPMAAKLFTSERYRK